MQRIWAPASARVERAGWRSLRLAALAVITLAVAACGYLTTSLAGQDQPSGQVTGTSGNLTCLAPSRPSSKGGCVTTDTATGISMRVAGAYADVTGTVVKLVAANTYNYPLSLDGRLALRSGYVLQPAIGGYMSWPDTVMVNEPLPPPDFAPRVEFIASGSFSEMPIWGQHYNPNDRPTPQPTPPWLRNLQHLAIRVPFMLSPARAGGFTYHMPPTVEQGIGVQVQSLDYSPAQSVFFGAAGGARVEVRFTGLAADLELLSFIRVKSERPLKDGGTSGDGGPGLFALTIPGMTLGSPVMTLLQSPIYPDNRQTPGEPTVGPTGTVQFEVAFPGGGAPTGQPATLTISDIQAITNGMNPLAANIPTLPAYQITLPMR